MKIKITRFKSNDVQTIGELNIIDVSLFSYGSNGIVFEGYSLELPDKENQKFISRIPAGVYECKKRWSLKFGSHIQVLDVPNRTWILIHALNFHRQTQGCIGIGDGFTDINGDGYQDLTNSKKTLKKILSLLPERFTLEIINED